MLTQRFLHNLISGPSYNELLLPVCFLCHNLTSFQLLSLVKARVPGHTRASASLPLGQMLYSFPCYVTSHYTFWKSHTFFPRAAAASPQERHGYQLAFVMKSILTAVSSPSPIPQPWDMGNTFGDSSLCTLLQEGLVYDLVYSNNSLILIIDW